MRWSLQVTAAGKLDDFVATESYIGGGPAADGFTGIDGSIRYLAIFLRALSDAEVADLQTTMSGTDPICSSVAQGM